MYEREHNSNIHDGYLKILSKCCTCSLMGGNYLKLQKSHVNLWKFGFCNRVINRYIKQLV